MPSLEARNSYTQLAALSKHNAMALKQPQQPQRMPYHPHSNDNNNDDDPDFDAQLEQVLGGHQSNHDMMDAVFLLEDEMSSLREEQEQQEHPQQQQEPQEPNNAIWNDQANQVLANNNAHMLLQVMPQGGPAPSASYLNAVKLIQGQHHQQQRHHQQELSPVVPHEPFLAEQPQHHHPLQPQLQPQGSDEYELEEDMVTKPKRQLTAYNLFFKQQRAKLLQTLPSPAETLDRNGKKKKKPRNSHGKIGFAEMAKTISAKWKVATLQEKQEFQAMAELDKQRYQSEMAVYRRTVSLISERKASSRASSLNNMEAMMQRGFVSDSYLINSKSANADYHVPDNGATDMMIGDGGGPRGVNSSNNMFLAML